MREAVIVSAVRTAIGKAQKGKLRNFRPDELASIVIKEAIRRAEPLRGEDVDDVIIGCAFPEAEQGMNVARIALLRAGLPYSVSGMTINRFCSSGLQAIAISAERIMCGFAEVIIAGGTESMSMVPMGGNRFSPNPYLVDHYPEVYISMGLTAERVAKKFGITREEQDMFALRSHQKTAMAIDSGRFREEIVPVEVVERYFDDKKGIVEKRAVFDVDEGVRRDTSMDALSKLKPVFQANGTVTAGNSSQMSDGASAVVVTSMRKAEELGLKPLAIFRSFAVCGVPPEIMGIGPVFAIPKAIKLAGLTMSDIDLFEINEAFASQIIYVLRELGIDEGKVNVNGGAIALGHPLGCTGARLTTTLLYEMKRRGLRYGVVSMCIGGGMGAAAVFESVN